LETLNRVMIGLGGRIDSRASGILENRFKSSQPFCIANCMASLHERIRSSLLDAACHKTAFDL
jgi:hypothetical protein